MSMTLTPPGLTSDDEQAVLAMADRIDRSVHAGIARATGGLSPAAIGGAWADWLTHMSISPGRQYWLAWKGAHKATRYAEYLGRSFSDATPIVEPAHEDHRFTDPAWQAWPFNAYQQAFLSWQQWVHNATTGLRGVSTPHERIIAFMARQMLDTIAPSNFLPTNPVVLQRSFAESGANLLRGASHLVADLKANADAQHHGTANPAVGDTVAISPGQIVFRNRLIELIQYTPTTAEVHPEPVLIVPAWIMKYYILDLSEQNSLVRYLVSRGFTVFMISWHNPNQKDRDLQMEDYLRLGVMAAIDAACAITGAKTLHATGYCLGGTLLTIAAAAMTRDTDLRLRSLTLLAAQNDFTEAGELTLFINDSQLAMLEDMMLDQGYLEARQMAGAFQMLHSNDLIWSHIIQSYMLGEADRQNDLMAWNADATRMPARMHAQYLRQLFLENDLAEGRYKVADRPVAVSDINTPIFAVGTVTDHVAPWRSVFKIHLLTDAEITFVLTSGGHNAGIVSEPGHRGRSFQLMTRPALGLYVPPETWTTTAPRETGSWWVSWNDWLTERSGPPVPAPAMGGPGYETLGAAPGHYVKEA